MATGASISLAMVLPSGSLLLLLLLSVAEAERYSKPVRYAGPIVYTDDKPPIVHFPKPSRSQTSHGGYGGVQRKAPQSIKYVPLPHHDLPVLIYQSDSQPPIHVVHTPAPHVAPRPIESGYSAPKPTGSGYAAGKSLSSANVHSQSRAAHARHAQVQGHSAAGLSVFARGGTNSFTTVSRREGASHSAKSSGNHGGSSGYHSVNNVQAISASTNYQTPPQSSSGYQAPAQSSSGYQTPTQSSSGYQAPAQSSSGYQAPAQSSYGYQAPAQSAQSDSNAVFIKSPPPPAPVYVNAPQPVFVTQSSPQSGYGAPTESTHPSSYKSLGGHTSTASQSRPTQSHSLSSGSYNAPPKGAHAPVTNSYRAPSNFKGSTKPVSGYKQATTSQPPHVIYAGHPPIHVYQQPEIRQVPHTPTKAYAPPVTKGISSYTQNQKYGVPTVKPTNSYDAPKSQKAEITSNYAAPTENKPIANYPNSVQSSYLPQKSNQKSKGIKLKGFKKYPAPRPFKTRTKAKPAPAYLPAPKAYNKPPIIIYQGVRPPVHVYRSNPSDESQPSSSYNSPSTTVNHQSNPVQPSNSYSVAHRRADDAEQAASHLSLDTQYNPQRRGDVSSRGRLTPANVTTDGWTPLGVAHSEMVPAAAYIMTAPDLSRPEALSSDLSQIDETANNKKP